MSALGDLVERARGDAGGARDLSAEAARMVGICNSCRYCEGYCAVFPSIERRLAFDEPTLDYLANLCHNCGACLYACQYAPPHQFAVNIPRVLAEVRSESYQRHAWPAAFGALYRRQGATFAVALAASLAFVVLLIMAISGADALLQAPRPAQSFYGVLPHEAMVALFGAAFGFAIVALAFSARKFHASLGAGALAPLRGAASAATLRNLEGGGEGCYERSGLDHRPSGARRVFHHLTFYGFLACFASTSLATVQHYAMHWTAPYPVLSWVVFLGTVGGIGLVVGPVGLLWGRSRRDPSLMDAAQAPLDRAFVANLLLVGITGLLLLAVRDTAAMPVTLAIHLGCVLAFFVTMPYGKFVHGLYRYLALSRYARESRDHEAQGSGAA